MEDNKYKRFDEAKRGLWTLGMCSSNYYLIAQYTLLNSYVLWKLYFKMLAF